MKVAGVESGAGITDFGEYKLLLALGTLAAAEEYICRF